ncbi:MAG TPA: glycosyltransferase [Patescibacteria group bacterium]|jgi:glycosyltransferase involved in cell wall biosynthesis|nr:glycosyltransferase [Patescibacteria group bacterium]
MQKPRATLICTVLNEESSIANFIDSIANQSLLPSEVIIVDGGSKDKTIEIIRYKIEQYPKLNLKVIVKDGNRSVGRNEAIKKATSEIILLSDAGCLLDKNWVKNISKPFTDKKIGVVAGYYKGLAGNSFQKSLIPYVLVMPDRVEKREFLPATRSMAFRKNVWKSLKGFDEKLSHNEDYAFANKIKMAGFRIFFAKNAIVYWLPRKNIFQAFKMFFRFALGDIQAGIFREKVLYIFLRYILAAYLLVLSFIEKSLLLNIFLMFCIGGYIIWSIWKNYKYIKSPQAFLYLPLLQFTSDLAVLAGSTLGLLQKVSLKALFNIIFNNKGVSLIILLYIVSMLSVISYGIPNPFHPFDYFMDEWHQSQSVRDLFRYGTPNMSGAANGSIFQFFLTGLYLIPFYVLRIVNPFAIKSSVLSLSTQTTLFEVLRLNTLLFAVFSIILLAYIAKKYFKINPFLVAFLFVFNPLWITLSNYFKYDIALQFWLLLAFLFMLRYSDKQKIIDFVLAGIFSALALATKLEPFNLLFVYIVIFLLFTSNVRKKIRMLILGVLIYTVTFLFFGIPDILLGKGSLKEYLVSNLSSTPNVISANLNLGMNYWQYFIINLYPATFGRVFYFGFLIFSLVGIILTLRLLLSKRNSFREIIFKHKYVVVLLLSLISYLLGLFLLRTGAIANRLIPLLPFMALVTSLVGESIYKKINKKSLRYICLIIVGSLLLIQLVESLSWNTLKNNNNPRVTSSLWTTQHIKPGTLIGIENIPIYQMIPDIVLKEFYLKQYKQTINNRYAYEVISSKTKLFPKVIIISDDYVESNYMLNSDKKLILAELSKQKYKKIKSFSLQSPPFSIFNSRQEYYMSALIQLPDTISIYEK